jgi:hypothetical protein
MIPSVIEAVCFLFLAIIRTPAGPGMIFVGFLLLLFRWTIRDKDHRANSSIHS